jgi:hypothetical protein
MDRSEYLPSATLKAIGIAGKSGYLLRYLESNQGGRLVRPAVTKAYPAKLPGETVKVGTWAQGKAENLYKKVGDH